jgi:quercetin dioxygenase-like cupin family protein
MATSEASVMQQEDSYRWPGSRMTIKARAEDTGGALGVVDARFYGGFGPPLHVPHNEDEALYVLEGEIRFRQGDEEIVAGPGEWVWGLRGVPHAFRVESETAPAIVVVTPGEFERMFEEGGTPVGDSTEPPEQVYDPAAAEALADRFGFDVVGPQLG